MLTRRQAQLLEQEQQQGDAPPAPPSEDASQRPPPLVAEATLTSAPATAASPAPVTTTTTTAHREDMDEDGHTSASSRPPRRLAASRLLSILLPNASADDQSSTTRANAHSNGMTTTTPAAAESRRRTSLSLRGAVAPSGSQPAQPSPTVATTTMPPPTSRRRIAFDTVSADDAVFAESTASHDDAENTAEVDGGHVPNTFARRGRPPLNDTAAMPAPSTISRRLQLNLRAATQQRMRHSLWTAGMAEEAQRWYASTHGFSSDTLTLDFDLDDDDGDEDDDGGDADNSGHQRNKVEGDVPPHATSLKSRSQRAREATQLFFPRQKPLPVPTGNADPGVATAPLTQSWHAVVDDLTAWTHDAHDNNTTTPPATNTQITLRQRVHNKRKALSTQQETLSDAIHRQYYVHLHEERMRQLLSCTGDDPSAAAQTLRLANRTGAHQSQREAENEKTYLDSLDRTRSEREAAVLDIITAIDQQLHTQFESVYRLSLPSGSAKTATATTTPTAPTATSAVAIKVEDEEETKMPKMQDTKPDLGAPSASDEQKQQSPQLDEEAQARWATLRLAALGEAVEEATHLVPAFRDVLMPYQKEGVRWMLQLNAMEQLNGILADDMGLGKTAQTLMYLTSYKMLVENVVQRRLERLLNEAYDEAPLALALGLELDALADEAPSTSATAASTSYHATPALSEAQREEQARQRTRLHRLVRETRLAKELKRWVWQLSEADVASPEESRAHRSSLATTYAALGHVTYAATSSPAILYMRRLLAIPGCSPGLNALLEVRDDEAAKAAQSELERTMAGQSEGNGSATSAARNDNSNSNSNSSTEPERLHEHLGRHCMRPILILAPLSTLPHWAAEFAHFGVDHLFSLYLLNGRREERVEKAKQFLRHIRGEIPVPPRRSHKRRRPTAPHGPFFGANLEAITAERRRRERAREEREDADPFHLPHFGRTPVLLVAHDFLARPHASSYLRQLPHVTFHVVVVDEAQRIKNKAAELFRRVCRLRSTSRLILTGTPLQNNIKELFALLQFIAPQSFHTRRQADLLDQLDDALGYASRSSATEDVQLHMLLCQRVHRLLTPFILRRDKSVLKAVLPVKKDFLVMCPLLPRQETELAEVAARVEAGTLNGNPHVQVRKILLHPYTRLPYFYIDDDITATSGKVLVLEFMMSFLRATGHKFLVFCTWTLVLDVVESLCQYRGIPYVRLDGNTSAETRESNIQRFNATGGVADGDDNDDDDDGEGDGAGDDEDDDADGDDDGDEDDGDDDAPASPRSGKAKTSASKKPASHRKATPKEDVKSTASRSHKKKVKPEDADEERENAEAETVPIKPATKGPPGDPCCFLISKVAGGVGLNLQSADTVFLLDVDYNPQRDLQALSRVYRVGQKREVRIFRLIVDHPVERNVLEIHRAKENLDQAVVQAGKFDLHSSADDRQAELSKLFGISAPTNATAEASDEASAMEADSASPCGSPVSPSAPLGLHLPMAASRQVEAAAATAATAATAVHSPTQRRRRAMGELEVQPTTPAEHLAAMSDTFREILPRSEVESEVLETMLHDLTKRRSARQTDHVQA